MQVNPDILNGLARELQERQAERHAMGEEKYGAVAFLNPDLDLFNMTLEEIIDGMNYMQYLYIRLRLMQLMLEQKEMEMQQGFKDAGSATQLKGL